MNYLQRLIKSLLIKAAGHKYIKRIPVGETKTGKVRYRYIYNATHTVGGKHLLDDAHLQTGTKLMLHSKEGEEVHVHVESVDGDRVKVVFDDGKNKGEEKTYSKKELLALFNKEHGVQDKLDEKKKELQENIKEGKNRGLSDKQINRLKGRLNRLGGGEEKKEVKQKGEPSLNKEDLDLLSKFTPTIMDEKTRRRKRPTFIRERFTAEDLEMIKKIRYEGVDPSTLKKYPNKKAMKQDMTRLNRLYTAAKKLQAFRDFKTIEQGKAPSQVVTRENKGIESYKELPARAKSFLQAGRDEDHYNISYRDIFLNDIGGVSSIDRDLLVSVPLPDYKGANYRHRGGTSFNEKGEPAAPRYLGAEHPSLKVAIEDIKEQSSDTPAFTINAKEASKIKGLLSKIGITRENWHRHPESNYLDIKRQGGKFEVSYLGKKLASFVDQSPSLKFEDRAVRSDLFKLLLHGGAVSLHFSKAGDTPVRFVSQHANGLVVTKKKS